MTIKIEGIWCPMVTPLESSSGGINSASVKELVNFLVDNGVDGLLPLGTSGEFALLSEEDRKLMLRVVVDATNGRVPVVAGVSDPCVENVLRFSKEAKDVGADGAIATPPYYFSTTDEGVYNHYKRLSESIDLPLLIYNIPDWTGTFVTPEIVGRLAEEKLVAGMKYTQCNFLRLSQFIATSGDKIPIMAGSDPLAYSNLEFGGAGAIISVANLAPATASKIYDEFKRGNLQAAKDLQLKLLPVIESTMVGKFPAGLKAGVNSIGLKVGPPKEPLTPLGESEKAQVEELLRRSGVAKKLR
jgi:4-hydroxy-tetrahydrodipicolinate synthase